MPLLFKKVPNVRQWQYVDALIPHLATTLEMLWESMSLDVANREVAPSIAEINTIHESLLVRRCGLSAVEQIKSIAALTRPATFQDLCQVQQAVLGIDNVAFRATNAFTPCRHERYAYFAGLPELFARKVAADLADSCPAIIKAARVYLDIIFVHPFPDGNARAAILWLSYFCYRARLPLPDYRRLFAFPFVSGSRRCYLAFVEFIVEEIERHGR